MNYSDIIRLTLGALQFGIACYALKLGWRFNAPRVGWLLFSGLSLLALFYLLLPLNPFPGSIQLGVKVDIIYTLISILLLAGMVHLDLKLKKRVLAAIGNPPPPAEIDSRVEEKAGELTKANEELQQTAAKLQTELAQRMQEQDSTDKKYSESQHQTAELLRANEELRGTLKALQSEVAEQKRAYEQAEQVHQDQLVSARQATVAGVADVKTNVLQNLDTILARVNSVSVAADQLARSGIAPVVRLSRALGKHASQINNVPTTNPNSKPSRQRPAIALSSKRKMARKAALSLWDGAISRRLQPQNRTQPLTGTLSKLARQLSSEHVMLRKNIDSIKKKLELLKTTLTLQQSAGKVSIFTESDIITSVVEEGSLIETGESMLHVEQINGVAEPSAGITEAQRESSGGFAGTSYQ